MAAERGECREIVEYLIDKGTDINIKDSNGVSDTIVLVQQRVLYPFYLESAYLCNSCVLLWRKVSSRPTATQNVRLPIEDRSVAYIGNTK